MDRLAKTGAPVAQLFVGKTLEDGAEKIRLLKRGVELEPDVYFLRLLASELDEASMQ